jgi:hypothetical protein
MRTNLGLQGPGHALGSGAGRIFTPQVGASVSHLDLGEGSPDATRVSSGRPGQGPPRNLTGNKEPDQDDESYDINLSFEGRLVRHTVSRETWVWQLRDDAARMYYLVSQDLVLVLFLG